MLEHPSCDSHLGSNSDLLPSQTAAEVSPPVVSHPSEEVRSSPDPVLHFLKELPNRTIPHNTANNLTQVS